MLLAAFPLLGFWLTGLFDLDEGFYGAVVAEMNRRGEWITPYYNGAPWFEKPILLYWLAKPFVMLFGPWWGPRMPIVLCALLLYLLIFRTAKARFGLGEAVWSTLILSSSLLMVALGRMMMTDVPLVLALSACFLWFFESLETSGRDRVKWRTLAGVALGISVLAKGPVGGIFFILLALWTYRAEAELRPRYAGGWPWAIAGFVGIVAAWYLPAYLANPQMFVQKFLIEQNVGRFAGGDLAHHVSFPLNVLMYPAVILVGFAPWCWWLKKAWPSRFSSWTQSLPPAEAIFLRFCARWVVLIFAFFFISGSKLPHYVLPIWPPLAIIVGIYLARAGRSVQGVVTDLNFAHLRLPIAMNVGAAILANVGFAFWYYGSSGQATAHRLVQVAKARGGGLAVFQLSRQNKDLGTGGVKIMETSLPSLAFYLDGVYTTPNTLDELQRDQSSLVFTRTGRLTPAEIANNGLERIDGDEKFVLFRKN